MLKKLIIISLALVSLKGYSQIDLMSQVKQEKRYKAEEVLNANEQIEIYEKLNMRLEWDSVRNCKGYACQGDITDYYENGTLLHKGFYVDGLLKHYINFFPSGKVEREFHALDDVKSRMVKYYPDGKKMSEIYYNYDEPVKVEKYYPDGQLKYLEEYNKTLDYHLKKKAYYADGKPMLLFEFEKKKKLLYSSKEFYENGIESVSGKIKYSKKSFEYEKIGKWVYKNEKDKVEKQETYKNGELVKEEKF